VQSETAEAGRLDASCKSLSVSDDYVSMGVF
jgi:hypothetical protein